MTVAGIHILGPQRIELKNTEIVLSGAKLRSILAVLALRAESEVRRDELIEELDLIRTAGDAINAVHAHVARLRRWLQRHGGNADLLETVNSGYRLNIDRDAVDAHRFVRLVERALNLAPGTPRSWRPFWRTPFRCGRGCPDRRSRRALVATAADELHRWRAAARETLIDAWLSLDHHQKVVLNARKFISEDPLNESMRARHIIALQRMGRHAEATEAYHDAETVLSRELGIRPGAELRATSDPATRFTPVSGGQRQRERIMIGARS
ncbi:BTAD domain-containing putative transcriptional regulator [Streptomyces stramineus]